LSTLSLTNTSTSKGSTTGPTTITNATASTLDLTVNGGTKGLGDVTAPTYTTVNVHTTGTDTTVKLIANAATALKIDGSNLLTLSSGSLSAVKTVTVSGAAGVNADFSGSTVTSVDVSASSAANTVIINANKATFAGGSGNDTVTIDAQPSKTLSGGAGTDTLIVNANATVFNNTPVSSYVTGFETLGLGSAAQGIYDASGFTALTQGGITAAATYTNVAAGVGLTLTATPGFGTTYTLKDATGTSDSLSLALKGSAAITGNSVTAAGIETVNITATDTSSDLSGTGHTLTLAATAAKTIVVTGNTTLTLDNTGNTKLTSVDASGMTGGLSYTTEGSLAEVVKGGASANTLTAKTGPQADTLIGGAGSDTLTANAGLNVLTGGAGSDTFVIQTAGANVNTYTIITDIAAGDTIKLANKGSETFSTSKTTLATDTPSFSDFANAVVAANKVDGTSAAAIGWFWYGTNTYIVEMLHNNSSGASPAFVGGTDIIVRLTGNIDLSTATLANISGDPLLLIH